MFTKIEHICSIFVFSKKSKLYIVKHLLMIMSISIFTMQSNAQSISLINNPDAGQINIGYTNKLIVYNGNLCFQYFNEARKYQLAKFDGNTINLIANPDAGIGPLMDSCTVIYGNNLYFRYVNTLGKYQLAKFDGNTISLISNPDGGFCLNDNPVVYRNNLYLNYSDSSGIYKLAKCDGSTINLINNPDAGNRFSGDLVVYQDSLYFRYNNASNKSQLAKYNGNKISLILNPDAGQGFIYNALIYGSTLYGCYVSVNKTQLAQFDGNSIRLITSPGTGYLTFRDNNSFVYKNALFMQYNNILGNTQLAKYDSTNIILNANPDAGAGINGRATVYRNSLYIRYINSVGNNQLAKYDSTVITLINNPTTGGISSRSSSDEMLVYNNSLYFIYNKGAGFGQLSKFDGSSITLINNPDAGQGFSFGTSVLYNNSLYSVYRNSLGKFQLAKYTEATLPLTILSFVAQKKDNNAFLNWHAVEQINVSHINIQRSTDGTNFISIGTVGTKVDGDYIFTDFNLPTDVTKIYYRLESVDKDATKTYSQVVSIVLDAKLMTINIYPNPVKNVLQLQLNAIKAETVTIQIADVQGKVLQQFSKNLVLGNNNISVATNSFTKGTYLLIVKGERINQKQFVKD